MNLSPLPRALAVLAALAAVSLAVGACGDDDDGGTSANAPVGGPGEAAAAAARPEVVFAAGGPTMDLPDEVPSGLVDIRIQATDDGQAHLLIARLNDGVSYEEFEDVSADASGFELVTVVGGNGTIAPGEESQLTVDLAPGDYSVVNIYFPDPMGGPQFAFDRFSVDGDGSGASPNSAAEPEADGTITLGPGMQIEAPDDLDGSGTWRFENVDDQQVHEAALVRLADGATADDLVEWMRTPQGPPPIAAEVGAMGALGPGQEAWMTLDQLEPGEYALVCFVPGTDGIQHVANGMVAELTVGAG
jgi:hypothetical protein